MKMIQKICLTLLLAGLSSAYGAHHEENEHEHRATPDQAEEERTMRASCAEDAAKLEPKFLDEKTCLETHEYKVKG
jgi:hypothetical protein|tara:strand:+ start:160 stop:387 length:228 start_codon:yes stop_codon:yes gene_type:complete